MCMSIGLSSLLGLQLSLILLSLLVSPSIGLHNLSCLLGLPRSPAVSHTSFLTCMHNHWSQQSLQSPCSPSVSSSLSYFFPYLCLCLHPLVSTVSPVSLFSLSLQLSLILLPLFVFVCTSTGLHTLSSLLSLPRSPTVSRTSFLTCIHSTSMRDSWRPRETKETGETVETSGDVHK